MSVAVLLTGLTGCNQNDTTAQATGAGAKTELLNVSYDVSRDFYAAFNPAFEAEYGEQNITVGMSNGGSSKQALSIANGLAADVATMNQVSDIAMLAEKGLVDADWQTQFPNDASPYSSTIVMLVREGNPKNIQGWADLTRDDVEIVIANPKTTGNGRYVFLTLMGQALNANGGDEAAAKDWVRSVLTRVLVYENGGRAATNTFAQRNLGDVLITFENEAKVTAADAGRGTGQLQIIYPNYSIEAQHPVAVVTGVTNNKGTTEAARSYLQFLWSKTGQQIAADVYLRPSDPEVLAANADRLPPIETFRPEEVFGDWPTIMSTYFADGGVLDSLTTRPTQ